MTTRYRRNRRGTGNRNDRNLLTNKHLRKQLLGFPSQILRFPPRLGFQSRVFVALKLTTARFRIPRSAHPTLKSLQKSAIRQDLDLQAAYSQVPGLDAQIRLSTLGCMQRPLPAEPVGRSGPRPIAGLSRIALRPRGTT